MCVYSVGNAAVTGNGVNSNTVYAFKDTAYEKIICGFFFLYTIIKVESST